jgi:hypothetical protein
MVGTAYSQCCLQETGKVQLQPEKQEKEVSEMETQPPPSGQNSCVVPTVKGADDTQEVKRLNVCQWVGPAE